MSTRKHDIPLGSKVCVEGSSYVYTTDCYQTLLECEPGCTDDHDCFPEPHICVRVEYWTSVPLSKVRVLK